MSEKQTIKSTNNAAHQIWTIGWNTFGQQVTGNDDSVDRLTLIDTVTSDIQIKDIQTGFNGSTYILLTNKKMIVMGNNEDGQLGLGLNIISIVINYWCYQGYINLFINNDVINVINAFTSLQYQFPKGSTPILITHFNIQSISHGIGSHHRFIITDKNRIYGCGQNTNKQIAKVDGSGNLSTWRQIQPFIALKIIIKQIAHSSSVSNFLSNDGNIYVIGRSIDGGLGLGRHIQNVDTVTKLNVNIKFISISCGHDHSIAMGTNFVCYSWGLNNYDQTGHHLDDMLARAVYKPTVLSTLEGIHIKTIDCGRYHTIWLGTKGDVYCAGLNNKGQCGHMCFDAHGLRQIKSLTDDKIDVVDVKCGRNHNCIKTKDNKYYLFGDNSNNECLVNPDSDYIKTPTLYDDSYFSEQNKEIVAIYPGFYETRIVTRDVNK